MTKEELKIWFWDKFNSCYYVEHKDYPKSVFMFYDINFIRSKKLANILDKEVEYPTEIKGQVLFELDFKDGYLYCDYDEIWSYFKSIYSYSYHEISELIFSWMEEYDKLKVLTPKTYSISSSSPLEEYDKLKLLIPSGYHFSKYVELEDHNKLKVLTPIKNKYK